MSFILPDRETEKKPVRLLLLEDDPVAVASTRGLIEKSGERVQLEHRSRLVDGIQRLEAGDIDLVLLDLELLDTGGIATFTNLRTAAPSVPIIVLAANDDEALALVAVKNGAQDFLVKGTIGSRLLLRAIRHALERSRLEERLQRADKMEAVGSLAGGVAHEFNNLLQVIAGYTKYALRDLSSSSPARRDLEQVLAATDRAKNLTRQLLGFSRSEKIAPSTFDPAEMLSGFVEMIRPLIGEHVEVGLDAERDLPSLYADRSQIERGLLNLCINARDAMPDGGRLQLSVDRVQVSEKYAGYHPGISPGQYIRFCVADNGQGMMPEVRERIFEPFFTTKDIGRGTGLGLAMVHGIVGQHGGAINVYSEPGIGTTFRVYLPTSRQAIEDSPADPPREAFEPLPGGGTILLAEDEPMVRDLAVRVLEEAGYRTLTAEDGDQAVKLFLNHAEEIDLAILDVVMPKRNGRIVRDAIRSIDPQAAVVFATGYDPGTDQIHLDAAELGPLLRKPFDPDELLGTVRAALQARQPLGPDLAEAL